MDWLRNLSDNELALTGCFGALVVSFGLVAASYHLGRMFRQGREELVARKTPSTSLRQSGGTTRRAA